jgi:hypothetical protein
MNKIYSLSQNASLSESCTNDKRLVVIWVDPESEPTRHIFNDLPLLKSELDEWGGKFLFLTDGNDHYQTTKAGAGSFNPENIKGLPANTSFCIDRELSVLKNSVRLNLPSERNLPVVIITDKDGKIYFISTGYRIGIGEQIIKYLK